MTEADGPKSTIAGGHAQDDWLEALYRQHQAGLIRFVRGVLRDSAEADDVVQMVFAKAMQQGQGIQSGAMKSWLYRVAFHEAISRKRRERVDRDARRALGDAHRQRSDTAQEIPEARMLRDEIVGQVREAIEQLPAGQQQVVKMRIYEEMTFAEIASETDLPMGTVLTWMRRALHKLRQKLPPAE